MTHIQLPHLPIASQTLIHIEGALVGIGGENLSYTSFSPFEHTCRVQCIAERCEAELLLNRGCKATSNAQLIVS